MALLGWQIVFAQNTMPITIYVAKKIITMNPAQPEATAVAVKDHRIYSVGSLKEMQSWMKSGTYQVDNTFTNQVITPGLIEAHCHWTLIAAVMSHPYVGYWDFPGPNGTVFHGIKTHQGVIDYLKAEDKKLTDPNQLLFAWNYDPTFLNNQELTAADLDTVSKTRPIFVLNASDHIAYVNSVLLNKGGYSAETNIPGVEKGPDGKPTGALKEFAAMMPILDSIYLDLFESKSYTQNLYGAADTAHRLGLTTVSDLFFGGAGENTLINNLKQAANDPKYPLRTVLVYNGELLYQLEKKSPGAGVAHLNSLIQQNSNNLNFGAVKFISDGSIQGFTARIKWPGYFNGARNGIFNMTTDELKTTALPFWKAGFPIHVHTNGNEATDSVLDVLDYLQTTIPRKSNIFVVEHNQMASPEQFRRLRHLGGYVNLFPNWIYFWGDLSYHNLLGPDRANYMDDVAEAKRQRIIFSIHTDSPVTPLGPLHSMWAAVNRMTSSGRVLGPSQRVSPIDALRAVTLNAAYLLNLQNEIGSIEVGKRADFTVLGQDLETVNAQSIKDIPVVATIQNGTVFSVK